MAFYSVFLKLYPGPFREIFADEMQEIFSKNVEQALKRSGLSFLVTCAWEIIDLPFNIVLEHWINYQEELQMTQNDKILFGRPRLVAFLLGLLGGGTLVITINSTTNGPAIFLPYTLLMIAAIPCLKLSHIQSFKKRFALGMVIFMSATIVVYFYIAFVINPDGMGLWAAQYSLLRNIWEHIWRLGLMFWIGVPAGLLVAQLSTPKQQKIDIETAISL